LVSFGTAGSGFGRTTEAREDEVNPPDPEGKKGGRQPVRVAGKTPRTGNLTRTLTVEATRLTAQPSTRKLMRQQLRQVFRRFSRTPLFTAVAVTTLGLGIGATTAMYAVVDGVLIEPLPYPDPGRLVGVWHEAPGLGFDLLNQGPAFHWTYRAENRAFEDVAMWRPTTSTITGLAEPEQVAGVVVTAGGLELLGAEPVMGRVFQPEDDAPGAPLTTLISYGYWQQQLGGATDVIGRTLMVCCQTASASSRTTRRSCCRTSWILHPCSSAISAISESRGSARA
jgi:hypothetical protein